MAAAHAPRRLSWSLAAQKRPFEQQAKAINEGKAQAGGAAKKQRVKEPPAAGQEVITLD